MTTFDPKKLIHFFTKVGNLKKIKRTGWVLRGVKNPESIAGHSFRVALMAWVFARGKNLNVEKVLKMALIHDLCEVYAGDITPHDEQIKKGLHKKNKEIFDHWPQRASQKEKQKWAGKKHQKEEKALEKVILDLPLDLQTEIKNLWIEYEEGETPEGRFVRQLDRVENVLQASEYRQEDKNLHMGSFWVQVKELADDPQLVEFIKKIDEYFSRKKPSLK